MNPKHLRLLFGTLLAFASVTLAQAEESISTTITPSAVSQYMFRGVCLGGPAFQPSVEVASSKWGVGVWASTPIDNHKVPGQSNPEIDPYAYYTYTVNDSISIVPGVTYYTYKNANTSNGFYKSTFEPSLALNYTVGAFKLTPKIYYDCILVGATYEITGAYTVPFKEIGTEITLAATLGSYSWKDSIKDIRPRIQNDGSYYQLGVTAPFAVTKNSKIIVGFAFTGAIDNSFKTKGVQEFDNSLGVSHGVASLSYSVTF